MRNSKLEMAGYNSCGAEFYSALFLASPGGACARWKVRILKRISSSGYV